MNTRATPKTKPWHAPLNWYVAALFPLGMGYFMYGMEASDVERFRLADPVAATGEFVQAECKVFGRRRRQDAMQFSYGFVAPDDAGAPKRFIARREIDYPSASACEADLPAARATRAPHPVWFERRNPSASRTTLAEPDSRRFLWLCLAAVPLVGVGWWVGRRARRVD